MICSFAHSLSHTCQARVSVSRAHELVDAFPFSDQHLLCSKDGGPGGVRSRHY